MMKRKTAAQYCDLSEPAFVREVMAGRLPGSVMFGGREHWDQRAIDRCLDAIAGNTATKFEEDFWNRGQAA
jgi:predicted DNA-binding transcriptional regulator AlpA